MRFSIRDLLWATLVVAMGLGWRVHYRAIDVKRVATAQQAARFRHALTVVRRTHDIFYEQQFLPQRTESFTKMDWSILDEPLVEP